MALLLDSVNSMAEHVKKNNTPISTTLSNNDNNNDNDNDNASGNYSNRHGFFFALVQKEKS